MQIGVGASNRRLDLNDRRRLRLMNPGVAAVKMMSDHPLEDWQSVDSDLSPPKWMVRILDIDRDLANLKRIHTAGYTDVIAELGNEPNNHPPEPWATKEEFIAWYIRAREIVRRELPGWELAFPGLSPGKDPERWWRDPRIRELILDADYLCAHSYYQTLDQIEDPAFGRSYQKARDHFPGKRLILSEYACTAGEAEGGRPRREELVQEYPRICRSIAEEGDVEILVFFILGGTPEWERYGETFDDAMAEALGQLRLEEEHKMPTVAVAIIPSNQDRNKSPWRPEYSEYGGLHWLAPLITDACASLGLNALDFQTRPESQDTYPLENLILQQERANTWLAQQPEPTKILVNIHTDSGAASHTYGIYASSKGGENGKSLAYALASRVRSVLATEGFMVFERLGSIDYNTYVFATEAKAGRIAVLIELCSHENKRDIETFAAHPRDGANAISQVICTWSGVNPIANSQNAHLLTQVDEMRRRLAKIKDLATV